MASGDAVKHCEAWYNVLAAGGMVMLRLSPAVHYVWKNALKKAKFNIMPGWGGYAEFQQVNQVLDLNSGGIVLTTVYLCRHRVESVVDSGWLVSIGTFGWWRAKEPQPAEPTLTPVTVPVPSGCRKR
jgi:hypothetical protein